jgi:hypothetical protein
VGIGSFLRSIEIVGNPRVSGRSVKKGTFSQP